MPITREEKSILQSLNCYDRILKNGSSYKCKHENHIFKGLNCVGNEVYYCRDCKRTFIRWMNSRL